MASLHFNAAGLCGLQCNKVPSDETQRRRRLPTTTTIQATTRRTAPNLGKLVLRKERHQSCWRFTRWNGATSNFDVSLIWGVARVLTDTWEGQIDPGWLPPSPSRCDQHSLPTRHTPLSEANSISGSHKVSTFTKSPFFVLMSCFSQHLIRVFTVEF